MAATDRSAWIAALLLGAAPAARAGETARAAVQSYSDDDGVSVVSVGAGVATEGERLRLRGHWGVDIVSAASVDLVSQASPRGFSETRNEADLGAEARVGQNAWFGLLLGGSRERDYQGNAAGLTGSVDLADGNATLVLRAVHSQDAVGRAGWEAFSRVRRGDRLDVSLTQLLDRDSAIDLGTSLLRSSGYLESPYRLVPLSTGDGRFTPLAEAVPAVRNRGQLDARYRRRLALRTFSALELSAHADDWGVHGGAVLLRVSQGLAGSWLTGTARARGYLQSGASFWRRRYEGVDTAPLLRTADKELSPMWSAMGGLRLEVDLVPSGLDGLLIDAGVDLLDLHYTDFLPLRRRTAVMTSLGVEARFR